MLRNIVLIIMILAISLQLSVISQPDKVYRPLVAGIRIETARRVNEGYDRSYLCSLGYPAYTLFPYTKGYVTARHCIKNDSVVVYTTVFQPYCCDDQYRIGESTMSGSNIIDTTFIDIENDNLVTDLVYPVRYEFSNGFTATLAIKDSARSENDIYEYGAKSGATTGLTFGFIYNLEQGPSLYCGWEGYLADYYTEPGDSGAIVFHGGDINYYLCQDGECEITVYGIHVGTCPMYLPGYGYREWRVFIPTFEIESRLPIRTYTG